MQWVCLLISWWLYKLCAVSRHLQAHVPTHILSAGHGQNQYTSKPLIHTIAVKHPAVVGMEHLQHLCLGASGVMLKQVTRLLL